MSTELGLYTGVPSLMINGKEYVSIDESNRNFVTSTFLSTDNISASVTFSIDTGSGTPFYGDSEFVLAAMLGETLPVPEATDLGAGLVTPVVRVLSSIYQTDIPFSTGTQSVSFSPDQINTYEPRISGSTAPNNPLMLIVSVICVQVSDVKAANPFSAGRLLSGLELFGLLSGFGAVLRQDSVDVLRQEYVEFSRKYPMPMGKRLPERDDLLVVNDKFNTGNYPARLGADMESKFAAIQSAYKCRPVVQANGQPYTVNGVPVTVSSTANFTLGSAYRNPRKNVAAGSLHPLDSHHVWGCAFDLTPLPATGVAMSPEGLPLSVPLDLHAHLYPTLVSAAKSVVSNSIVEQDAKVVPLGDPAENHVHLQW